MKHPWELPASSSTQARPKHPWEQPRAPEAPRAPAAEPAGDPGDDSDMDETDVRECAARSFLDYLGDLYLESKISADDYCTLCYFAARGGLVGAEGHGVEPGKGHCSRKCRQLYAIPDTNLAHYTLEMPGRAKDKLGRVKVPLLVAPAHEAVDEHARETPELARLLEEAVSEKRLPPNYFTNPVVQRSEKPLLPLSIYMDAAPYSLTDGVLGIWLQCLVTDRKWIIALVRKKITCACGCRGWCSFSAVMRWLRYTLEALAAGKWPEKRHDGKPWITAQDQSRADRAGTDLSMGGVLVQFRGDWAEVCERLGLPTWSSNTKPCPACVADKLNWHDASRCSMLSFPWHLTTHEDLEAAARRCEIRVSLDRAAIRQVVAALKYDKRTSGDLGRSLVRSLPEIGPGLQEHDRLEPSDNLPDVGDLEKVELQPGEHLDVIFWRRSRETACLHRSPLWSPDIGVTLPRVVVFDLLHNLYLGVMNDYAAVAVWKLIDSGCWGGSETNAEEAFKIAVMLFREELFAWYRSFHHEQLTRVTDVTTGMLGKPSKRKLKTKGAETYGVLVFLIRHAIPRHTRHLAGEARPLLDAGEALYRFVDVCRKGGATLTSSEQQDLISSECLAPFLFFC